MLVKICQHVTNLLLKTKKQNLRSWKQIGESLEKEKPFQIWLEEEKQLVVFRLRELILVLTRLPPFFSPAIEVFQLFLTNLPGSPYYS